mgnify:CR=1 FL=1
MWKSSFLLSISSLLTDPNPDDPLNIEIANLYKTYLEDIDWLVLPPYYSNVVQTWWQYIVKLDNLLSPPVLITKSIGEAFGNNLRKNIYPKYSGPASYPHSVAVSL